MVHLLSDCKKDQVNMRDHEGMTALHWASFHKRPNHLKALLRKGAREDVMDVDQKSPLHWAAQNGSPMCCQMLLLSRSTQLVNHPDKNGNSCLHLAAAGGHCNVVKVLARVDGVNLHARDHNGRTPLHWAAAAGHDATCEALLIFKCDPTLKDSTQKTPLDYAKANKSAAHKKCAKLIKGVMKGTLNLEGNSGSTRGSLAGPSDDNSNGDDAGGSSSEGGGQSMKTLAKISRALIAIKTRDKADKGGAVRQKPRDDDRAREKEPAKNKFANALNQHRRGSNVSQSSLKAVSEEDINALELDSAKSSHQLQHSPHHSLTKTTPLPSVGQAASDPPALYSDVVLPNNLDESELLKSTPPALRTYTDRPSSREVPALRPRNTLDAQEESAHLAELKQLRNRVGLLEMELNAVKAHDIAKNNRITTLEEHVQFWKQEAQAAQEQGQSAGSHDQHYTARVAQVQKPALGGRVVQAPSGHRRSSGEDRRSGDAQR